VAEGDARIWQGAAGDPGRSELCLHRVVVRGAPDWAEAAVFQSRLRRLGRNHEVWARSAVRGVGQRPSVAVHGARAEREPAAVVLAVAGRAGARFRRRPGRRGARHARMDASSPAQAQALTVEAPFCFDLRRREVIAQVHVPAAQLLAVLEHSVLGGGAVQLHQHRAGAGVRRPRPAHVRDMHRLDAAQHGAVHGRGVRPVLVQLNSAPAKHAVLKHSKELRGRHVRLCGHLMPAQLKI